jgi:tetratricopeptide (TPR) repeat protein
MHLSSHTPSQSPSRAVRHLVLCALLALPVAALADDYADVKQLMRAGQQSLAMEKANAYLANRPRDPQMRFLKGVIQSETGKSDDAIATFTSLTQEYPELPEPYNNLAVLYAARSDFDKARTALETAVRANPSYATAHENLGDVYARLAAVSYSRALQLEPANKTLGPKLVLIREMFTPKAAGASGG